MANFESVDTVIDRFLDYVKTNGKVALSDVTTALAITPSQAERLASLLEQSGFIEVQYGIKDVTLCMKKQEEKEKASTAESHGKSKKLLQSEELEREVVKAGSLLKFFEKDILRRIAIAENRLASLQEKGSYKPSELQQIEAEIDLALGQLAAFSQEVKALADTEEKFYNELLTFKQKLHALKNRGKPRETVGLLQRVINWIKQMFASFTPASPAKRKRVPPRKRKPYDSEHGITFFGKGPLVIQARAKKRLRKKAAVK